MDQDKFVLRWIKTKWQLMVTDMYHGVIFLGIIVGIIQPFISERWGWFLNLCVIGLLFSCEVNLHYRMELEKRHSRFKIFLIVIFNAFLIGIFVQLVSVLSCYMPLDIAYDARYLGCSRLYLENNFLQVILYMIWPFIRLIGGYYKAKNVKSDL